MNNSPEDTFERIARDAVSALIAASMTLAIVSENRTMVLELAATLAKDAEALCDRAIALGGE